VKQAKDEDSDLDDLLNSDNDADDGFDYSLLRHDVDEEGKKYLEAPG
jgi:hypothetical protein